VAGLAVIAGVGHGLGASLARRFGKEYKVVLLARSEGTLNTVSEDIKREGGDVNPRYAPLIYRQLGFQQTSSMKRA
jgi:short-subunit dehydrogenase